MSRATLVLEAADEERLEYVVDLLEANGLPSSDVRTKPECFYVARDGDETVGVGGVEIHGSAGLLRSVVVEGSARGEGLGTALCERLEAIAEAEGVEELYLLTTTAREFFAGRGYEEVERSEAPADIRGTAEFADLCPSTAVCMRKRL
jgi:amino-acid N-acetyltransferase